MRLRMFSKSALIFDDLPTDIIFNEILPKLEPRILTKMTFLNKSLHKKVISNQGYWKKLFHQLYPDQYTALAQHGTSWVNVTCKLLRDDLSNLRRQVKLVKLLNLSAIEDDNGYLNWAYYNFKMLDPWDFLALFNYVKLGDIAKLSSIDNLNIFHFDMRDASKNSIIEWAARKKNQDVLNFIFALLNDRYSDFLKSKKIEANTHSTSGFALPEYLSWAIKCNQIKIIPDLIAEYNADKISYSDRFVKELYSWAGQHGGLTSMELLKKDGLELKPHIRLKFQIIPFICSDNVDMLEYMIDKNILDKTTLREWMLHAIKYNAIRTFQLILEVIDEKDIPKILKETIVRHRTAMTLILLKSYPKLLNSEVCFKENWPKMEELKDICRDQKISVILSAVLCGEHQLVLSMFNQFELDINKIYRLKPKISSSTDSNIDSDATETSIFSVDDKLFKKPIRLLPDVVLTFLEIAIKLNDTAMTEVLLDCGAVSTRQSVDLFMRSSVLDVDVGIVHKLIAKSNLTPDDVVSLARSAIHNDRTLVCQKLLEVYNDIYIGQTDFKNLSDMLADYLSISKYIQNLMDRKDEYLNYMFGLGVGVSKENKLKAATALKEFILGKGSLKELELHEKSITQGRLFEICKELKCDPLSQLVVRRSPGFYRN